MKKLFIIFIICFPILNNAQQPCKELFISEYIDGNNKNKILELYNPSDSVIDLTGYYIRIYQNGAPTPDIVTLQGNVNSKETYVIAHPQADNTILAKANQTDVKMNFDGNDAIVLRKGISTDIDKIGETGVNPGSSGWTLLPNGSTKDSDLRRKFPIDKGETDWNNGKQQWTVLPKDSLQNIKIHNNTCNQPTLPTCSELFISEYLDGTFKNKAIEIFNPTDSAINLTDYSLQVFQNGASTPLNIPLQGTINAKETFVVTHPQANSQLLAMADQTHVNINFDGNDAIALKKGQSTYIDKIGEIAINPGNNGWTIPPNATTKDVDLRRKFPVDKGEGDWNNGKNQWDVFPKDSILNIKQHLNICAATYAEVNFKFDNPSIIDSSNGFTYFNFDILGYLSNNSDLVYLHIAYFQLEYDTTVFGDSLGTSSNGPELIIYQGQNFSTGYSKFSTVISDAIFSATLGAISPYNRTLLTTTPKQLLNFKIKIKNCGNNSNIHFTDIAQTALQTRYSKSETTTAYSVFDKVNYVNSLAVNIPCDSNASILWISDFTPQTITAGTNSILTINGAGFTNTLGVISLTTAAEDDNGSTVKALDSIDIFSWSDNQIKVVIPSTSFDTIDNWIAGTGQFYVTTLNDYAISGSSLIIPYAITNVPNTSLTKKYRINLANMNDTSGYIFRLDTSISNHPDRKSLAIKAINDWNCLTKINWSMGSDIINNSMNDDGVSVIAMDPNFHGNPQIALTNVHPKLCDDLNNPGQKIAYAKEIDINLTLDFNLLNPNYGWFYDTTFNDVPVDSIDFYAAIIHELGHGHILTHVNDTTDLMYWGEPAGYLPYTQRKYFTYAVQDGGLNVVAAADTLSFTPSSCSGVNKHTQKLSICTSPLEIKMPHSIPNEIKVYPNPANYSINIEYKLLTASNCQIRIYDITGREILNNNTTNQEAGYYYENISINSLSNGIYLLFMNINSKQYHFKIIKN